MSQCDTDVPYSLFCSAMILSCWFTLEILNELKQVRKRTKQNKKQSDCQRSQKTQSTAPQRRQINLTEVRDGAAWWKKKKKKNTQTFPIFYKNKDAAFSLTLLAASPHEKLLWTDTADKLQTWSGLLEVITEWLIITEWTGKIKKNTADRDGTQNISAVILT